MKRKQVFGKSLYIESLEERRLLATFTVDDSFAANDVEEREFTTIQAAVNAAATGDTIRVRAGTYEENVVVNKQLTIKGADAKRSRYLDPNRASILDPVLNTATGAQAVGFDLQANGIVIKGFTIGQFDNTTDTDGTIGIRTSASFSGYTIKDNVIEENTVGIQLNTTSAASALRTRVEDNVIRNNDAAGTNTGNGIFSNGGLRNAVIRDNEFTGTNAATSIRIIGIDAETDTVQSEITIEDNDFEDLTGGGIYWERVIDSVIEDNDFENLALVGIHLNGGNVDNTIEDNELETVGTSGINAIILSNASQIGANTGNLIEDNEIEDAGQGGLVLQSSNNNIVRDNEIERSRILGTTNQTRGNGITLLNADNNLIEDNEIEDNARNGISLDSTSTGNTLLENESEDNDTADASGLDFSDATTGGTGPSGVQNTYTRNKGGTQNKTGLIARFT
jgi:parallel beta-helix repeat protein